MKWASVQEASAPLRRQPQAKKATVDSERAFESQMSGKRSIPQIHMANTTERKKKILLKKRAEDTKRQISNMNDSRFMKKKISILSHQGNDGPDHMGTSLIRMALPPSLNIVSQSQLGCGERYYK